MVEQVMKKFSKIDILVNNAIFPEIGKMKKIKFEDFPLDVWEKGVDVNLTGMFLCSQQVGKIMVKQKKVSLKELSR